MQVAFSCVAITKVTLLHTGREGTKEGRDGAEVGSEGVLHEMHSNYISPHTRIKCTIYATQLYNQMQTEQFLHKGSAKLGSSG